MSGAGLSDTGTGGYREGMAAHRRRRTIALIGNPASDKGRGARMGHRVLGMLSEAGSRHGFAVVDLTGDSYAGSLRNARERVGSCDALVVVGGDGMVHLGVNAAAGTPTPLGIVAIGSGNDFARGLRLPIDRPEASVNGIVGALVNGTHREVDLGRTDAGDGNVWFAGTLSCGLDASINDRANRSRLPGGTLRYAAALLTELTRLRRYGYRLRLTLPDGTCEERDLVTPLLAVANARHVGGGIELSPYSRFSDGLLDLVWLDHMPGVGELADAVVHVYDGRLLGRRLFGWTRVRDVAIDRAPVGDEPPTLMADGERVGGLPIAVAAVPGALRVLMPPSVAGSDDALGDAGADRAVIRDGRDPATGLFVG